jgi:hypothetical protein
MTKSTLGPGMTMMMKLAKTNARIVLADIVLHARGN